MRPLAELMVALLLVRLARLSPITSVPSVGEMMPLVVPVLVAASTPLTYSRSTLWLLPAASRQVAVMWTQVPARTTWAGVSATSVAPALSVTAKRSVPPERRTRWKDRFDVSVASNSWPSAALDQAALARCQNEIEPSLPSTLATLSSVSTPALVLLVLAGTSSARQTTPPATGLALPRRTPP